MCFVSQVEVPAGWAWSAPEWVIAMADCPRDKDGWTYGKDTSFEPLLLDRSSGSRRVSPSRREFNPFGNEFRFLYEIECEIWIRYRDDNGWVGCLGGNNAPADEKAQVAFERIPIASTNSFQPWTHEVRKCF